jgi:hypothetical protein
MRRKNVEVGTKGCAGVVRPYRGVDQVVKATDGLRELAGAVEVAFCKDL